MERKRLLKVLKDAEEEKIKNWKDMKLTTCQFNVLKNEAATWGKERDELKKNLEGMVRKCVLLQTEHQGIKQRNEITSRCAELEAKLLIATNELDSYKNKEQAEELFDKE